MIESGPLCITDLFQNKSVAYLLSVFFLRFFYVLLSLILCNFLVRMLKYFFLNLKMCFCPQKVAYLWQLGVFFSAAPTAQNSPELHARFINSFVQPSLVGSVMVTLNTANPFFKLYY